MTISYTGDVANASGFGCFNKILFKWKGSVYKLIYKVLKILVSRNVTLFIVQELLAYLLAYMALNLVYRNVVVPRSDCNENGDAGTHCKMVRIKSIFNCCLHPSLVTCTIGTIQLFCTVNQLLSVSSRV